MQNIKLEQIDTNFLASMATGHHNNITNIANRSYFMSIKINQAMQIDNLFKPIFIKLNMLLYDTASVDGSRRSSLIISADVEGTRKKRGEFHDPLCKHLHAVWILSPEDAYDNRNYMDALPARASRYLHKLREIPDYQGAVHIKRIYGGFDGWRKSIGYATKAYREADRHSLTFPTPRVFPYEIELDQAFDADKPDLQRMVDRRYRQLCNIPWPKQRG